MSRALRVVISFALIIISLVIVTSCAEPTPASSANPAEISGNVVIPEVLCSGETAIRTNEGENLVFWIVEILVENKSYSQYVSDDYESWRIEAGGEIYPIGEAMMNALHYHDPTYVERKQIAAGQSDIFTFCFTVPDTLKVSDAALCYHGQEPISYGELTGGDQVEAYNWNSRTVMQNSNCVNA